MSIPKPGRSFDKRDPAFIKMMMPVWDWLYRNYFRVETGGWHNMPEGKTLVVGSHNGGLTSPDLGMFLFDWFKRYGTGRLMYGLMHREMWRGNRLAAEQAEKLGAVEAHPKVAFEAFNRGASVLVFPGGGIDVFRPFHQWDKIHFAERRGFIKLALREGVPITPLVSVGAHHTLYVLADLAPVMQELIKKGMPWPFPNPEVLPIYLGAPTGLTVGPLPNIPIPRKIYTRVGKPIVLDEDPKPGKSYKRDFIEECYQRVLRAMQDEMNDLIADSEYTKELPKLTLT